MKKLCLYFAMLSILTSCVSNVAVSPTYWNQKSKVGIFVKVNAPEKFKEGAQGLLDMAVTSGGKYDEALKVVATEIKPKDLILKTYTDLLQSKGKEIIIIDENFDPKTAKKFEGQRQEGKKYSRFDFSSLKSKYGVDEVLFINFNYGFMISYYSMIETGRSGFAGYQPQIINLSDNALVYSGNSAVNKPIKKWKDNNYKESVKAIEVAVNESISTESAKLN